MSNIKLKIKNVCNWSLLLIFVRGEGGRRRKHDKQTVEGVHSVLTS